jgi:predicted ArsR family transcriptional regulator
MDAHSDDVAAVGVLGEPTRRALYEHVAAAGTWVSRDAAADAVGVERATAAHHLDRLATEGLLDVEYRRLTGRRGPGAGRPAKLYRRSRREVDVSLPPRSYAFAGDMLAEAADRSHRSGADIVSAVNAVAAEEGAKLADQIRARIRAGQPVESRRRAVLDVLATRGFEPETTADGTVVLRNCPFHQLSQRHTELICGMNHCLLSAAVDEVDGAGLSARLEPADDQCCVRLHRTGR